LHRADSAAPGGSAAKPGPTSRSGDRSAGEPALAAALAALRADRPVAFPTETVWGLAVSARSEAGMAALRAWKGRDAGQPVSVLVSDPAALEALGIALPPLGRRLAEAFWPGPLTLVVPCRAVLAAGVARADGALGLRCSPHPAARGLARAAEAAGLGPLTATSLNRHGEPPAADLEGARTLCAGPGAPHLFFDRAGGDAGGEAPSTIVDLTTAPARVLRAGPIDARALSPFGVAAEGLAPHDGAAPDASGTGTDPHGLRQADPMTRTQGDQDA